MPSHLPRATTVIQWDLSADRANAARKFLQQHGVRADQVRQVRGFADQNLRNKSNPDDASNRRVSVIVQYMEPETMTQVCGIQNGEASRSDPGGCDWSSSRDTGRRKATVGDAQRPSAS